MTDPQDRAEIIGLPPVIFGLFVVLGVAESLLSPVRILAPGFAFGVGLSLIAAALFIATLAMRTMKRARTEANPRKPTTAIVSGGPYRYTRNPLYLSLTLIYLGLSLCLNSLAMAVLTLPLMMILHCGVILPEERYLERKFGDAYRSYRVQVRRWV